MALFQKYRLKWPLTPFQLINIDEMFSDLFKAVTTPTPLAGTHTFWVATTSGGAVTTKLTFTDGILTAIN